MEEVPTMITQIFFEGESLTLSYRTWPIDSYKQGKYFPEIFETIYRIGTTFKVLYNLAICSN